MADKKTTAKRKKPQLERWEKFCIEYATDVERNATAAYRRAGFNPKTTQSAQAAASRMLKEERVQQRLQELGEKAKTVEEKPRIADVAEVMEFFTRATRGEEKEETTVVVDGETKTIQQKPQLSTRIKAATELGKMLGGYTVDVNIRGKLPVVICGEEDIED